MWYKLRACDPRTDPDFIKLKAFLVLHPSLPVDPITGVGQYSAHVNGMPDCASPIGPAPQTVVFSIWERLIEKGLKFEKTFAALNLEACFKLVESTEDDPDAQSLRVYLLMHPELPPDRDTGGYTFSAHLNGVPEVAFGPCPHAQYALIKCWELIAARGIQAQGVQL